MNEAVPTRTTNILRNAAYGSFFFIVLLLSIYLTFPWEAAKAHTLDMIAENTGIQITIDKLEPSWLTGVVAHKVVIVLPGKTQAIAIERVELRAKIFAFLMGRKGFTASMPIGKGSLTAGLVFGSDSAQIKAEAHQVEMDLIPGGDELIGVPIKGLANINTDLSVNFKEPQLTSGVIDIKANRLRIDKGSKISGYPLPELAFGDLDWKIPVEAGKARLKALKISGDSLEAALDGTIAIFAPLSTSNANLTIAFKPSDMLIKSEPLLGVLLNNIQQSKGKDGFYAYTLVGPIGGPRFMPQRR